MRTFDQLTALTLEINWPRIGECINLLTPQGKPTDQDCVAILAKYPLPLGLRAYNMTRLGSRLCLTTHMGGKHFLFMDSEGHFEVGPTYADNQASMLTQSRNGNNLVLGPIGKNSLDYYKPNGQAERSITLCPSGEGYGVWRLCSLGNQELVILKNEHQRQRLLLVHPGGRVTEVDHCGLLAGITNRVRHHGGKLYFLQNSGPHILVAELNTQQTRLSLVDVKALHGASPMGFDVTGNELVVAWNDRIMKFDHKFAPQFCADAHGFESMDLLEAAPEADTIWLRNQDYSALLLAKLTPADKG